MTSQIDWNYASYLATKTLMSSIANKKYARKCKSVLFCQSNELFAQNKVMREEQLSWA